MRPGPDIGTAGIGAEAEVPSQFTHSVKLSETAKGIRIDVHVYANDKETAIREAFQTYSSAISMAKSLNIPLAPMEVDKK